MIQLKKISDEIKSAEETNQIEKDVCLDIIHDILEELQDLIEILK